MEVRGIPLTSFGLCYVIIIDYDVINVSVIIDFLGAKGN
jgi:hypothetical protein